MPEFRVQLGLAWLRDSLNRLTLPWLRRFRGAAIGLVRAAGCRLGGGEPIAKVDRDHGEHDFDNYDDQCRSGKLDLETKHLYRANALRAHFCEHQDTDHGEDGAEADEEVSQRRHAVADISRHARCPVDVVYTSWEPTPWHATQGVGGATSRSECVPVPP